MTSWLFGERAHLIGIGGAGMNGVARLLLSHGVAVSGSDTVESASVRALRDLGAHVLIGHDRANLPANDVTVVMTTALRPDNPRTPGRATARVAGHGSGGGAGCVDG